MESNFIFFQQEVESQKNRFEPPNGSGENWINRQGVAKGLPVTPYVPTPKLNSNDYKIETPTLDKINEVIENGSSLNQIESVPLSQLRYETIKDSFNTLEIICLILIFLAIFKVFTSKRLFSNSKKEKATFLNQDDSLKKTEEHLEKINKFRELLRKRDDGEMSWEECELRKKELFNL